MRILRSRFWRWAPPFCATLAMALGPAARAEPQGCRSAPKIVGGSPARIEHWPGFAALRLYNVDTKVGLFFCGGAAITPDWVVTAAHCFNDPENLWRAIVSKTDDFSRVRLDVVLGADNLDTITNDNVYPTEKWFQNETYAAAFAAAKAGPKPADADLTAQRHGHDIALVKLARAWQGPLTLLSLSPETDPVAPVPPDRPVTVVGFGSIDPKGNIEPLTRLDGEKYFASTPELLEVGLPFVDEATCKAAWPQYVIGAGQLCAGFNPGKGKDSCNGDSGGPIVSFDDKLCPRQIGLVSWGAWPCAPGAAAYGVYTRISAVAPWLKEKVPELK